MAVFHRLLGWIAAPLVVVLALTGIVLAFDAILRAPPSAPPGDLSVAAMVERLGRHGHLDRLTVTPDGLVVARFDVPRRTAEVDPATGDLRPRRTAGEAVALATELHRSLALGDGGRLMLAAGSFATLLLLAAGLALVKRRDGRGDGLMRLHRLAGIVAAVPVAISAATGLGLAASALSPLSVDGLRPPAGIARASGERLKPNEIQILRSFPITELEELVAPLPDDPEDVWRLTTTTAFADVDPVDGRVVAFRERPVLHGAVLDLRRFHAGWGRPLLAGGFGLGAALILCASFSGLVADLRRRRAIGRLSAKVKPRGGTVILVGTERGTTLRFAERLADRLAGLGRPATIAAMNEIARLDAAPERLLVLTATWRNGGPPASADLFLTELAGVATVPAYAVLGFGDRTTSAYCAFAEAVDHALAERGGRRLLPLGRVDRRSEADFAAWVDALLADFGGPESTPPVKPRPVAAAPRDPPPLRRFDLSGPAMGSHFVAKLFASPDLDADGLARRLAERLGSIEAALSRFRAESEVVRFDRVPVGRWVDVGPDLARVLAVGLDVGRRSGGAFDLGLAAEVAAAGFARGWAPVDAAARRDRTPAHLCLELDLDGSRVRRTAPIALDLAGIAKGYAVDELARLVAEAGIPSFLVGLDGELRAGAPRPDGRPWAVGVEAPTVGSRDLLGRVDLVDRAVATSGDYRRFDRSTGAGHTLDPRTGRSVAAGPAAVTTLAASCVVADAWATALMVAGRAGLAAARDAGVEAIFVDRPIRTVTRAVADTPAAPPAAEPEEDGEAASHRPIETIPSDRRPPTQAIRRAELPRNARERRRANNEPTGDRRSPR